MKVPHFEEYDDDALPQGNIKTSMMGLALSDDPITPEEAKAIQSREARAHGGVVLKGSVGSLAEFAAAKNLSAGVIVPCPSSPDSNSKIGEVTSKESGVLRKKGDIAVVSPGLALSDHPITPLEAKAIQAEEAKQHAGLVLKKSLGALAESAAAKNVNAGIVPPF